MAPLRSLIAHPPHSDTAAAWPLVIFLHGMGERGENLSLVEKHGPPAFFNTWDAPCFCAAPQCPGDAIWTDLVPELEATLDDLLASYPIDPARISLTGFSMGGFGSWQWALDHPDRFTAIAPVAGGGFHAFHPLAVRARPRDMKRLKGMNIRILHGRKDEVVPLIGSQMMAWACWMCGVPVETVYFRDADHVKGARLAYQDGALVRWLSEQQRK